MTESADILEFPSQGKTADAPSNQSVLVNGAKLLDEIASTFRRHLSLPDRAPEAIALWVLFAHSFDAWQASPRLLFTSPVPQCGKSTALMMLGKLTPRARLATNITRPVVFLLVEHEPP